MKFVFVRFISAHIPQFVCQYLLPLEIKHPFDVYDTRDHLDGFRRGLRHLDKLASGEELLPTDQRMHVLRFVLDRVDVELAHVVEFELAGRPPGERRLLQQGFDSEEQVLLHLVDVGLTGHAERHVEVIRVAEDELVGSNGGLLQDLRDGVFELI